jgi:hypothetical protein
MVAYLVVIFIIWLPGLYEAVENRRATIGATFALLVAGIFTAMRFETGYDWVTYKALYVAVGSLSHTSFTALQQLSFAFSKELAFVALSAFLNIFSDNFQLLIVFAALVAFYGMHRFLSRFSCRPGLVFAASFSFLLFTLYFSVLRQSLSVGFFLLFVVSLSEKRRARGLVFLGCSVLVQYSAIIYLVLYLLGSAWPRRGGYWLLLVALLASVFVDPALLILAKIIGSLHIGWVAEKIIYYVSIRSSHVHWLDKLFNYSLCAFFTPVLLRKIRRASGMTRAICGMGLWLCVAQLLFIDHPIFRYRLFYLILPMQFAVFFDWLSTRTQGVRCTVAGSLMCVCMAYGVAFLAKPNSTPFIPYQFWPYYQITDQPGTGEVRAIQAKGKDF